MFLQSLEVIVGFSRDELSSVKRFAVGLIPGLVTSSLLWLVVHQEIAFSIITGFIVMLIYRFAYNFVLRSLPFSFTLGEAAIVTQGFIVFLYNCYLKLPVLDQPKSTGEELNILLQIGLIGVFIITITTFIIPVFRKWIMFYLLLISVIVGICLVPVENKFAITILINFVFGDIGKILVVGVYIALLVLAGVAVTWQIRKNQRGTTSARKIFHILIVMVFVPGLIYQCQFLYVASVVALAIFIVLELARVIKLFPVAEVLELSVAAFIDEKDAGKVALTPIYLLVGCSLPLWIHNSPCDLTGSSSFELLPLISGVLSIGIGDTFASVVGSSIGRHKWLNSNKSVEGTIASIVAQAAFIYALYSLGFVPLTLRLAALCGIAVITNSLVEALTDQVDNLVLPIITFIILSFK